MIYRTGQSIDHYRIIRLLGQGIASHVYHACDLQTEREVVLKFPLENLVGGPKIYARYLCEAEVGKCLIHPAIQQHVNQDEERSKDYLVLEYLQGQPLRVIMHQQTLSPEEIIRIISQVCTALSYAHKQGVIHRDIKPENVMVLDTGEVKLIDFGIALFTNRKQDRRLKGDFVDKVGTPTYMSPERLLGKRGDERCDIYAVGVMLYELLSGRTPFPEQEEFAFVNEQASDDPPGILQFQPNLSPALAAVVMRAIRRNPQKRYSSMEELRYDLTHLNEEHVVDYVPDRPLLFQRYRIVIQLTLIILLICIGVVIFGIVAQLVHGAVG